MMASWSSTCDDDETNNGGKRKSDSIDKSAKKHSSSSSSSRTAGVIGKGEWVTHLSLPIEFEKWQIDLIGSLRDRLRSKFVECISDVIMCDEFHMSVSRTLRIKKSQIDELVGGIEAKLKSKPKFTCYLSDVVVLRSGQFGGEEKRKLFLAFKINSKPAAKHYCEQEYYLDALVSDLNTVLKSVNQPEYYKNATFHISFAYIKLINDVEDDRLKLLLDDFKKEIDEFLKKQNFYDQQCQLNIERVKLKCGNILNFFKLG